MEESLPEQELPQVDEALVSRLVAEFRASNPADAPAVEPAVPGERDELFDQAVEAVRERGRGSVVVLQRRLGIGFTRATRVLAQLVEQNILGAENASGSHPLL